MSVAIGFPAVAKTRSSKSGRIGDPKSALTTLPSPVSGTSADDVNDQQVLKPFARWVGESMWVPPRDSEPAMADTILKQGGMWTPRRKRWPLVVRHHRHQFTHVREVQMAKPSIRLPNGRILMKVTSREQFDTITETIPACVQTRLDEFLAGPGRDPNVRVYYIEPLCVEVDDQLIFTSRADVQRSITEIRDRVDDMFRRMRWTGLPKRAAVLVVNYALSLPGRVIAAMQRSRRQALQAYHTRLECERRKTALRAAAAHRKFRTDGCSYDEMLALTNPLNQSDVAQQYAVEQHLSQAQTRQLVKIAVGTVPWFVAASAGIAAGFSTLASIALAMTPAVVVCDPAFVAEMPGSDGVLLNIGHFDDIAGVRHVEI